LLPARLRLSDGNMMGRMAADCLLDSWQLADSFLKIGHFQRSRWISSSEK
jgi:hypothetical protein